MNYFTTIDLSMLILYLIGMVVIGYLCKEKVSSTTDYYLAGRSLGAFVIMATVSASIIGGAALIGRGGIVYNQGVVGILLALPYLIGMYAFSFISGRIQLIGQKYNITSIPDLMEYRFGSGLKNIVALLIAFTMMATVGSQITATATILKTLGGFSYEIGAWIAVSVFVTYTLFSGLYGVAYTDVAQFLILIVFVYIVLPVVCILKMGGVMPLFKALPDSMLRFDVSPQILGWIFTNLLFTLAGAEMWQRAFASKTPKDARKGMFLGNSVYGLTIIISVFLALSAIVLLPDLVEEFGSADAAMPALVIRFLPIGLTGITIAALMAVMMSSADTYLLISVQTVVSDLIKPLFKKEIDDKKLLSLSRVFTVLLGFGALIIALYIRQAYHALMFAWTFYAASLGIPAIAALYSKKVTILGMKCGIFAGFLGSIGWRYLGSPYNISPPIFGGIACIIALVVVSWKTYNSSNLTRFPEV